MLNVSCSGDLMDAGSPGRERQKAKPKNTTGAAGANKNPDVDQMYARVSPQTFYSKTLFSNQII